MATAGTIMLEIQIAIDIVLAEDGKYYVDAITSRSSRSGRKDRSILRPRRVRP
jgi:hypothetical protein